MKTLILTFALLLALLEVAPAQILYASSTHASYRLADTPVVIAWKYENGCVWFCFRENPDMPYDILEDVPWRRTYDTGPKLTPVDARIPSGIHTGRIEPYGDTYRLTFTYRLWPIVYGGRIEWITETYRLAGPTLDPNTISIPQDEYDAVIEFFEVLPEQGIVTFPFIVLPDIVEEEVLDRLIAAGDQESIDRIADEILYWHPLAMYILETGLVPEIARGDGHIIVPEHNVRRYRHSGVLYNVYDD
ncbi:MAG: hypothetical protein KFH87_05370 [Bacteroidetes bacterium]|nr:hypothetical protein [Bacteroidota bacterium]